MKKKDRFTTSNGFLFINSEKVYCEIYDRGCGEWCGHYHKNVTIREVYQRCCKPMKVIKLEVS